MAQKRKGSHDEGCPTKKKSQHPTPTPAPSIVAPFTVPAEFAKKQRRTCPSRKRAQRAKENSESLFWTVPGELRNMIYDLCVSSSDIGLTYKRYVRPPRAKPPRGLYDGFSFLHTCSQMRTEFKGFYYEKTNFKIRSADLEHFLALLKANDAPLPKKLVVAVKLVDAVYKQQWPGFDYREALKFKYQHPECEVDAQPRYAGLDIWEYCKDIQNQEWTDLVVLGAISTLVATNWRYLVIVIREQFLPYWMRDLLTPLPLTIPARVRNFVYSTRLGLPTAVDIRFNCLPSI